MSDPLVDRLREAGCVFAEEEAAILRSAGFTAVQLEDAVARRAAGEPLEHLVGWVDFGGLRLAVGAGVFIPRQRSIGVAHAARREVAGQSEPVFVEAYAGVAPLAAFVAADRPDVDLHVTEIDPIALEYAARNVPSAAMHLGDGLSGLPDCLRGTVLVIAAVPPHVPDADAALMPGEARDHEPERTHVGGTDGLDYVRKLIDEAVGWLRPGGVLLCELHRDQADSAVSYATHAGWHAGAAVSEDGHTALVRCALGNRSST